MSKTREGGNRKNELKKSANQDTLHTHILQESKYERDGLCYDLRKRKRVCSVIHKFNSTQAGEEANCRLHIRLPRNIGGNITL